MYGKRIKSAFMLMNTPVPGTVAVWRRQVVEERVDE
jgi:hypothetical protein